MNPLLIKKLLGFLPLAASEQDAMMGLRVQTRSLGARMDLPHPLSRTEDGNGVHVIRSGFACRYRYLADGRRQILCFLLPGDIVDIRSFILGGRQSPAASLSELTLDVVPNQALLRLLERFPRITRAIWWSTLVEESIAQEWLVNIGQRSAIERTSHLFCELYTRLDAVGLVKAWSFDLPVTQNELADTLGLSTVHVNRTLQQLRRLGHLTFENGKVRINDFAQLSALAQFSPAYLYMRSPEEPTEPAKAS